MPARPRKLGVKGENGFLTGPPPFSSTVGSSEHCWAAGVKGAAVPPILCHYHCYCVVLIRVGGQVRVTPAQLQTAPGTTILG